MVEVMILVEGDDDKTEERMTIFRDDLSSNHSFVDHFSKISFSGVIVCWYQVGRGGGMDKSHE